ncbi:MAG: hypothetical protein RBT11_14735 [Desulfobacterales bacterium]|nr:hypothetical protein [Desulfobacterales bacterium]
METTSHKVTEEVPAIEVLDEGMDGDFDIRAICCIASYMPLWKY